jgi:hypothetical protein
MTERESSTSNIKETRRGRPVTLQERAEIQGKERFLGVPVQDFEKSGREQLIYLLKAGINPGSKVIDLGCGILRAGYWLIHFLNPGNYCGIESHKERLEIGIQCILEPQLVEGKRPRFDTNPHFNTSVFNEKFDFFLAYSVWTHASKQQIQAMLDAFVRDAKQDGVFLTTYLPANWRHRDYRGDSWCGTSHESDVPGCIHHSLGWIRANGQCRGLTVQSLGRDKTHGQSWLRITRYKK